MTDWGLRQCRSKAGTQALLLEPTSLPNDFGVASDDRWLKRGSDLCGALIRRPPISRARRWRSTVSLGHDFQGKRRTTSRRIGPPFSLQPRRGTQGPRRFRHHGRLHLLWQRVRHIQPSAIPATMHRATQSVRYRSKDDMIT